MTRTSQVVLIARREFVERARSRVFIGTLIAVMVLIFGGMILIGLVSGGEDTVSLGVAGDSPPGLVDDVEAAVVAVDINAEVSEFATRADAESAIEGGAITAALVDGMEIISSSTPSASTVAVFSAAANTAARRVVAADLGLTDAEVAAVVAPVPLTVTELDPDDPDEIARGVASFLAALVLLTTIMMFGQFVAMGVVEEKQNRVIEVVLAKVSATRLLIGKVAGIGALGLVQIVAIAVAVVVGLRVAPIPDLGVPDLAAIGLTAALWLVFWFVLGYLLYSFMYAMLGATVSRQEDLQSVAYIPAMAILPAYFITTISAESGANTLVRVASFVPLWTPIIMPFRINVGDAAVWEIVLAIAVVAVTVVVFVVAGSRVYRGAALRTGARISLREAWRSADG